MIDKSHVIYNIYNVTLYRSVHTGWLEYTCAKGMADNINMLRERTLNEKVPHCTRKEKKSVIRHKDPIKIKQTLGNVGC